jgi:hypothetical protein
MMCGCVYEDYFQDDAEAELEEIREQARQDRDCPEIEYAQETEAA